MSGVKGRSGRKPLLNERTLEEIMGLSSEILQRWLSNPLVADKDKIQVVSQIIIKRIPAKLEHSGDGLFKAVIINYADQLKSRNRNPDTIAAV